MDRQGSTPKSLWCLIVCDNEVSVPDRYLSMRTKLDGDKMGCYSVSLQEVRSRCKKTEGIEG